MRFLCFQRQKYGQDRKCRYTTPVVKTMPRRYGPVTDVEVVSRKRPVLVTGAHDSGKSRWLERLYAEAPYVWGKKSTAPALWLGALRPLAAWSDQDYVSGWWDARAKRAAADGQDVPSARPWAKLKTWERAEALPDYLRDTGAVLFLDDAHKLTGRKLQIARECALAARLYVVSASEEQRIPPNLRGVLMRRDPQIFRLDSEVAYDATNIFVWCLALALLAAGAWEASVAVAGLKALASGRRASRQDA